MSEKSEIKRKIFRLSSRLYGDIRTICGTEALTQSSLERLIQVVTLARIKLAFSLYACAKKLDAHKDKQDGDYLSIISRCYYCHYHLARAAVFFITRDDIDDHRELPKSLGKILPLEYAEFISKLEQYRDIRNEVEYRIGVCITKHIVESSIHKLWLDYDEDADVLYISLQRPQKATDSIMKSPTTGAGFDTSSEPLG